MLEIVAAVKVIKPYVLEVWFAAGVRRRIDIESLLYGPVFTPLRDTDLFAEVSVDAVPGTVVWPNGADLSPEFLYSADEVERVHSKAS